MRIFYFSSLLALRTSTQVSSSFFFSSSFSSLKPVSSYTFAWRASFAAFASASYASKVLESCLSQILQLSWHYLHSFPSTNSPALHVSPGVVSSFFISVTLSRHSLFNPFWLLIQEPFSSSVFRQSAMLSLNWLKHSIKVGGFFIWGSGGCP